MNILILGAAGFLGTNLSIKLAQNKENKLLLVDKKKEFFEHIEVAKYDNVIIKEALLDLDLNFEQYIKGQDVVYHLVSTTVPTTSNQYVTQELTANVIWTSKLLDSCVRCNVKKVVFISSGGTVYGKEAACPLKEETPTNPITSYGVQKITIEKLLYLYNYMYGLDYRIIRLSNPYGPYQRPNGILGAVTTFTYNALRGEDIVVYGDGTVVRDFIYIDDVIKAMIKIVDGENKHHTFNLGCGYGTSINELLAMIQQTLNIELNVIYKDARKVDVPVNFLDISRYEKYYGKLTPLNLGEGIRRTADFMGKYYKL